MTREKIYPHNREVYDKKCRNYEIELVKPSRREGCAIRAEEHLYPLLILLHHPTLRHTELSLHNVSQVLWLCPRLRYDWIYG